MSCEKSWKPRGPTPNLRMCGNSKGALVLSSPGTVLWAATFVGRTPPADLASAIAETKAASAKAEGISYREESDTSDEIARVWFDTLLTAESADTGWVDAFDQWLASLKRTLFTTTLTHLARLAARSPWLEARALDYAGEGLRSNS